VADGKIRRGAATQVKEGCLAAGDHGLFRVRGHLADKSVYVGRYLVFAAIGINFEIAEVASFPAKRNMNI
jgi:hypothetical protein